jgi:hypothetical protein
MPTQSDASRPIRTVDSSGKTISTDTNSAAAIKTVDSIGRIIDDSPSPVDAPASSQQAQDNALLDATGGLTPEVKATPDAEARKLFLDAQKAKRRADEMEKKAAGSLAKAEAFEKAISLAQSGEDPTAVLTAAGLDPIKFYQNMTQYALSDKGKPEDPVQKELREHRERLDKYSKDLEQQANTIKEKEEMAAHNQVIASSVIPMLNANPEKYETLLMEYGPNAAVEVYKTVYEIYQQTGKARKFDEVADEMEKYWSDKVEAGLNNALKLKKFHNRFSQSDTETSRNKQMDHQETTNRSPTLSNKHNTTPVKSNAASKVLTREERVAEILKRHGV